MPLTKPKTTRKMKTKMINGCKCIYKGTEKSPKGLGYCAHCVGDTKMTGKDGNLWITQRDKIGRWRWIKLTDKVHKRIYGY